MLDFFNFWIENSYVINSVIISILFVIGVVLYYAYEKTDKNPFTKEKFLKQLLKELKIFLVIMVIIVMIVFVAVTDIL